jgi:hypothetical protein
LIHQFANADLIPKNHCAIQNRGSMKRNPRPRTDQEIALLGTCPDAKVAEPTGRTFSTVWQKRRALGIAQPTFAVSEVGSGGR